MAKHILVIEDDIDIGQMLLMLFEMEGWDCASNLPIIALMPTVQRRCVPI
jgi:hypoxanthine-guanine phosphoribosyltransferase